MAKISEQERKPAPEVEVAVVHKDQRKAIMEEHRKPEFHYAYHRADVTDTELEAGGWEKVGDGKGGFVHHMGDPLIRRLNEVERKVRHQESKESYETVKDRLIGADKDGSLRRVRAKKTPKPVPDEY